MKRSLPTIIIILLSAIVCRAETIKINDQPQTIRVISSTEYETILEFSFGSFEARPITVNGQTYTKLNLEEWSHTNEKGNPELPFLSRSIIIPDDKKPNLEVIEKEVVEYTMHIIPSKGVLYRDQDPASVPYEFGDVYKTNAFFPATDAEIGEPYILRDFRGVTIKVFPFQYNPVTGLLKVYHKIRVKVSYDDKSSINVKIRNHNKINRFFEPLYQQHFINYETGGKYPTVPEQGRIIVICDAAFMDEIAPYVEWKLQKGIQTDLYNVSTIGNTTTNILNFIQGQYDLGDGLTFVQLVGDASEVVTPTYGLGGSDPTYSLLEGNDYYPDIFIGRFSAETEADIETQVERTIHYERDLSWGGWLAKGTGIASDQGAGIGWQGNADWEHMDYLRNMLLNFNYTSVDQFYDTGTPTSEDISNAVDAGRGIINYCGHGSTYGWVTTGFSSSNVNDLQNDYKLPFIHSVGCVNGNFVSSTCFAEAWLRATNNTDGDPTGAIAMYASSINQSWEPPMVAQDYSVQHLVNETFLTIGGLWYNGSCAMIDIMGTAGYDMFMTWHIFGDASLAYRTRAPHIMTVSHAGGIGDNQITFPVQTDEPGALVCLSCPGQILASGYTNASGYIALTLPPSIPCDEPAITISNYNAITYTATLLANGDGRWTGAESNNWHDPDNWGNFTVPSADDDIIIPDGCVNYPYIYVSTAFCKSLTIENGAELSVYDEYFNVYGFIRVYGSLHLMSAPTFISVEDNIYMEDGSVMDVNNDGAEVDCYGQWYNKSGADVKLDQGTINFVSGETGFILNQAPNCYFNNIVINKSAGSFMFHPVSSYDLVIMGDLTIASGNMFTTTSDKTIILNGALTNNGNMALDDGTLKLTGTGKFLDFNTGDYLNNLDVSTADGSILYNDIQLLGDMILNSGGVLTMADIYIMGSWFNYGGTNLFGEGNNKVVFNGNNKSYLYGEDFYTLELNGSCELYFQSGITSCQYYNWENGNIIMNAGTVNMYDLVDNGLYGTIIVESGTMNIYQDASQYPDLNCELYQNGGTINIFGGTGMSYWSAGGDAEIVIEDGVLDFKDVGIRLYDSPSSNLGGEINGGTVRTAGSLIADAHGINITDGTFEMYGPNAAQVSCSVNNFHHLEINKTGTKSSHTTPVIDPRQPDLILNPKANDVSLNSAISLNGNLTVSSGTLDCQGHNLTLMDNLLIEDGATLISGDNTINIYGNWTNHHGSPGFIEGYGLVNFLGTTTSFLNSTDTFYDMEVNKTGSKYEYVWLAQTRTATILNDLIIGGCSFRLGDASTLNIGHDLVISENANLMASGSTDSYINVGNNWFNYNTTGYPWDYGFVYGISTVTFNGTDDQFVEASYGTQEFYNLTVNKADNWFMPVDHVNVYGDAEIVEGSWNQDATGLMFSFYGDLIIQANGSWDDSDNNLYFKGPDNTLIKNYGINNVWFESIYISKDTPSNTVGQVGDLHCYYLSVTEGEYYLNDHTLTCDWRIQVSDGGKVKAYDNATIRMADQGVILVGAGARIELIGNSNDHPTVTHVSGNYGLSIYAGGVIAADNALFEYMNTNGLYVYNNGLVDNIYSLNNCTFRNGQPGGTLIRLSTPQKVDIENAFFPANTWGGSFNVSKTYTSGVVNMINASGDFSGETFENDPYGLVNWSVPGFDLDVKVFLEGPFNNGLMNFTLMPDIPLSQPFNMPPWNYNGTESVTSLPGKTVDWVLVELRDAPSAAQATAGTVIARQAAFLKNNGYLLDLDGSVALQFNEVISDGLYLVIWQRNHLPVISAYELINTGGVYAYDFTNDAGQAHGDVDAMKEIAPGVYGMVSGDANLNGAINAIDKGFWEINAGKRGYLRFDFNLDGEVDNADKNDILLNNYGWSSQVPQ